ncbi:MAG: GGDEF domain-containing phosphodiesterase [Pseudomonadota bacterium]
MNKETESFIAGLMKWDALLGQRVLDAISFLVPAFLFTAFALSPKANDLQNGLIQFCVLCFFLVGSFYRLVSGWNRLRSFRFQIGSALFDIGCLFAFLLIIPIAYGSPIAISLKAPTANLLFVFIISRIVFFDIRLIVWSGISASLGWCGLTLLAMFEPNSPGITHEFVEYMTSGKILVGAQVEHVISILLVMLVSAAVVNAYQRDGLTGLRKKREFIEALKRRLPHRARRGPTALILVQIENWHALANANKSSANKAIKDMAMALLRAPVPHDMAARFEADSVILWKRCADDDTALRNHLELLRTLASEVMEPNRLSVRIGAVRAEASAEDAVRKVVRAADRAEHAATKIQIYDAEFAAWVDRQSKLYARVENAVDRELLVVHYQPIVDMLSTRIVGTEALLRLRADDGAFVSPATFIPIAERTGAIDQIGAYVLETASQDSLRMRQLGLGDDVFVSVNVAPLQIHAWERLRAGVEGAVQRGTHLKLEVTESSAAQDKQMHDRLLRLRASGAKLAIDDFGTGYSSLERLGDLPFDTVKIDIAFTRKITSEAGFAMIDAIARMAAASGKDVIIEGIENAEQQALALKAGIRYGQGFHFSPPVSVDELLSNAGLETELRAPSRTA